MRRWVGRVIVLPKPSVNDPQGLAVLDGLSSLGFSGIERVRVGRSVEVYLSSEDEQEAARELDEMCRRLLANTLIESYTFEVCEEPDE